MKKNIFITMTAMVAIVFTSCNVNDEVQDNNSALRFTATVGEATAVTKAAGTTWTADDAIGIFMVNSSTTTIAESADNRQYTTTENGTFTAAAGHEIYYPVDGSPVDFIAYYPYKAGTVLSTPVGIQIATPQTAVNQPTFDLLYSADATGYSKASTGAVALTFAHKLSKIVMNIVQPSTLSPNNTGMIDANLTGMTVSIKGMNTVNTFNLTTGTLETPGTVTAITPRTLTDGKAYNAIILPGNYAAGALTVEFTLTTGEIFTWHVGTETFEGGNEYTYAVTLTRTGVTVTGTITPWTTIDRGDVTAE